MSMFSISGSFLSFSWVLLYITSHATILPDLLYMHTHRCTLTLSNSAHTRSQVKHVN